MSHVLAGARGRIEDHEAVLRKAQTWGTAHGADVLLADARCVLGRDHLESAALHAERAQAAGSMSTRTLAMEALLYLTGHRQVADAIRIAGLRPGTEAVAVVMFQGDAALENLVRTMGWTRDDGVLSAEGKSLGALGISAREAATVPEDRRADLALERTALLDVEK